MVVLDPIPLFPQWPDILGCLYKQLEPSDTLSWQLQFSSYTPESHVRVLVLHLVPLLLVQFSANVPGKAADDGPSSSVPTTHVGDPNGVLGSWLLSGPALAVLQALEE